MSASVYTLVRTSDLTEFWKPVLQNVPRVYALATRSIVSYEKRHTAPNMGTVLSRKLCSFAIGYNKGEDVLVSLEDGNQIRNKY